MKTNDKGELPAKQEGGPTLPVTKELSESERFTQAVIRQYTDTASGELQLTAFMQSLTRNYFIKLDQVLKATEQKRLAKKEDYREKLEYKWKNVNMNKLAVDVVAFAGVGLDPTQPNHIHLIPYKNNTSTQYDIVFMPGYKGKEIKARKYGLDVPDEVIVELIYANDEFKMLKRDINNRIESYLFNITDPFDRGELKGGFYYYSFFKQPEKNKVKTFTLADIMKRKPDSASPEFWGGEKDKWEKDANGKSKKNGKEKVEGWLDEMAYKTVFSAAWGAITIDAAKIDAHYRSVLEQERKPIDAKVLAEIKANANLGESLEFEETKGHSDDEALSLTPGANDSINPASDNEPNSETEEEGPGF